DIAVQSYVACTPDFTHAARAEPREDFVWADQRAWGNRHSLPPPNLRRLVSSNLCPSRSRHKARRPLSIFFEFIDYAVRGQASGMHSKVSAVILLVVQRQQVGAEIRGKIPPDSMNVVCVVLYVVVLD